MRIAFQEELCGIQGRSRDPGSRIRVHSRSEPGSTLYTADDDRQFRVLDIVIGTVGRKINLARSSFAQSNSRNDGKEANPEIPALPRALLRKDRLDISGVSS